MALAPGDRISKIQEIGRNLADETRADVDLTLGTFGVPPAKFDGEDWVYGEKYQYILRRLGKASEAAITGLHAHISGEAPTPAEPTSDPPAEGEPLVFISHTWKNKVLAAEVSDTFAEVGIKGFVAHEDIEPSKDWAAEIERNLHACSALAAILTDDFPESPFSNQEIGYAFGRGRLVVGVMQNQKPPPGLAAKYQAIPGTTSTWKTGRWIAVDVLDVLFKNPMTRALVVRSMALLYTTSVNYDNARENYERLLKIADDEWTDEMMERVEQAPRENSQLAEGNYKDPVKGWQPIPVLVKHHLDRIRELRVIEEGGVPADSPKFAPAPAGASDLPDFADLDFGPPSGAEDDIPF
jgi:hypothetical protein